MLSLTVCICMGTFPRSIQRKVSFYRSLALKVFICYISAMFEANITERYAVLVIGGGGGGSVGGREVCRKREINTQERTTTKCHSWNSAYYCYCFFHHMLSFFFSR